ncbi:MAG: 50S ribosomal protein L32 [Clostridia bacterium]
MAVPKRKTSKQRKHKRTANWKVALPTMVECPECHELKLAHHVCKKCGTYDGKKIVEIKEAK